MSSSSRKEKLKFEKSLCTKYDSCSDYVDDVCALMPKEDSEELRDFIAYLRRNGLLKSGHVEDARAYCSLYCKNRDVQCKGKRQEALKALLKK